MIHVHAAAGKNTRNAVVNQNEPEIITSTTYIYLIFTDQKKIPVPRRWVQFQRTRQEGAQVVLRVLEGKRCYHYAAGGTVLYHRPECALRFQLPASLSLPILPRKWELHILRLRVGGSSKTRLLLSGCCLGPGCLDRASIFWQKLNDKENQIKYKTN